MEEKKKKPARVYQKRKKKWVPRLHYLINRVVVPRFDKKHRLYIDQPADAKVELYVSKDSVDVKAGIPAKIIGVKDLGDHAYVLLESATFTAPSQEQVAKFIMNTSIEKNVDYGEINYINCALGNMVEFTYRPMDNPIHMLNKVQRFIIGMAFGTLWKIPYNDYKHYVPKDIDPMSMISFFDFILNWYKEHLVEYPNDEQIINFMKHHPDEFTEDDIVNRQWLRIPSPLSISGEVAAVGHHLIAIEKPCIVAPYRSDIAVEPGFATFALKSNFHFRTILQTYDKGYDAYRLRFANQYRLADDDIDDILAGFEYLSIK